MSEKRLMPIALSCGFCGASMHFDIVSLKKLSDRYKKTIRESIGELREIYLPFQLFTGSIDASIMRYGKYNSREYELKLYMNQKVVIACDNVDNDLIEKIEPFNMDKLVPFEFNYIAGH